MFAFECVIDSGTYDDFKECVLAIVYLPPILGKRRLRAVWTCESEQDLMSLHSISADSVLTKVLSQALREFKSPKRKRSSPVFQRGGESPLHPEWA